MANSIVKGAGILNTQLSGYSAITSYTTKQDAGNTDAFSNVLNKQADVSRQNNTKKADSYDAIKNTTAQTDRDNVDGEKTQLSKDSEKLVDKDVKKTDDHQVDTVNNEESLTENETEEVVQTDEDTLEEDYTETFEKLGEMVAQLYQTIQADFEITAEEIDGVLDEMGIDAKELLASNNLNEVVLKLGGASDSLSLLTDEKLYQDYNEIVDLKEDLITSFYNETKEEMPMDELVTKALMQEQDLLATVSGNVSESVEIVQNADIPKEDEAKDDVKVQDTPNLSVEYFAEDDAEIVNPYLNDTTDGKQEKSDFSDANQNQKESGLDVNAGLETKGSISNDETRTPKTRNQHEAVVTDSNVNFQNTAKTDFSNLETNATTSAVPEIDTEDVMRQIMDYMRVQIKPEMSQLEMQLHPENLGTIQIQIANKGGNLTAQFTAQNEAVKALLETQMIQLKENFEQQGVKVEAIEVSVQTQEFNRNLDQGNEGRQEEAAKKNRTRKIRLDGDGNVLNANELDEGDQLAADMMQANGNTVDYTA